MSLFSSFKCCFLPLSLSLYSTRRCLRFSFIDSALRPHPHQCWTWTSGALSVPHSMHCLSCFLLRVLPFGCVPLLVNSPTHPPPASRSLAHVFLLSFSITCSIRNIATFPRISMHPFPCFRAFSAADRYSSVPRSLFTPVVAPSGQSNDVRGNPHRGPDDTPDPVSDFPDLALSRMPPRCTPRPRGCHPDVIIIEFRDSILLLHVF